MTIEIRPVATQAEYRAFIDLEQRVWTGVIPMREDILRVMQVNGGLVLGAFDAPDGGDEKMVGLLLGYVGRAADGRFRHWSHMVGVDPAYRDQHIGYRLKLAQRERVLAQGLDVVAWSYDPLLSRNAHLNIHRLGAVCHSYWPNFYGDMTDELNAGLPSDRFEVEWPIASAHVVGRLSGRFESPSLPDLWAAGIPTLSAFATGETPQAGMTAHLPVGAEALIEIPHDFHALKRRDIALARAWRDHTRGLFESVFACGYWVTDFLLDGDASYYLLKKGWHLE
jgi:predicted GNAT superfamily acetyltransferase